jgi:hypothetical protein
MEEYAITEISCKTCNYMSSILDMFRLKRVYFCMYQFRICGGSPMELISSKLETPPHSCPIGGE